ncbi:putative ribonuclease H-like domain-containing protein [Tanacetum coccineum]
MDVKSDFFYEKIKEEVYVCQPPGLEDPEFPDRVYKVEKALYGLHQAPEAWYETLSTYLLDNRFQRGKIDNTLFIKRYKCDILLMSSMGELTFFLGLQVKQKKDGIFISQDKYVDEILKKFGFTEVKTASTPIETQKPLINDEDGEEVDVHMYMSMIGSLMYLTSSRPDSIFAVCACARYQVNLKVSHLHAVKRIFSDYAGASLDRKSTTGGLAKKSVRLMMGMLFGMELELILAKTINGEEQLHALVDGKKIIITESSVRRDLQLEDEEDEAVHKELGDSLVRAATIASSLEAEQDSGNINKTQSKATPNESSSEGTNSGGGPWCQETMRDTIAQTRVESSDNEDSLGEDVSKQGRIDAIDADEEITLVIVHDVNVFAGEEVFATTVDDITLAQVLEEMKSTKPKKKEDKGKGILIEPVKPMNKKDLIRLDEETALNLQAEFDEEERLVREKARKEEEANITLIETWDDIQANIDADHQLAERMQAQEQEELSIEERLIISTL